MSQIAMTYPHALGRDGARQKVNEGLRMLIGQVGRRARVESGWTGDTLQVRVTAMGQTANARVDVGETDIRIFAQVPMLLSPFSKQIQGLIDANAGRMLGAPTQALGRRLPPRGAVRRPPPRRPGLFTRLLRRLF